MKKVFAVLFLSISIFFLMAGCAATEELADGKYTIDVTLEGGSGKASVKSPAKLNIEGETMTAIIEWSSPFYEYMLIGDLFYEPVQTGGNATFEIPVVLDSDMAVSASTVAMSQPHLVDYTLHFDSSTIKGE